MKIEVSDAEFAMLVEEVARLISGAPFPSKKSLTKSREVVSHVILRIEEGVIE